MSEECLQCQRHQMHCLLYFVYEFSTIDKLLFDLRNKFKCTNIRKAIFLKSKLSLKKTNVILIKNAHEIFHFLSREISSVELCSHLHDRTTRMRNGDRDIRRSNRPLERKQTKLLFEVGRPFSALKTSNVFTY